MDAGNFVVQRVVALFEGEVNADAADRANQRFVRDAKQSGLSAK